MASHRQLKPARQLPKRFHDYCQVGNPPIQLPAGKEMGVAPPNNYRDQSYFSMGYTYISVKVNTNVSEYAARFDTPVSKQYKFTDNPQWIMGFRQNKYFDAFTDEEVDQLVEYEEIRNGGFPQIWIYATEAYDDSYYWRPDPNYAPHQTARLLRKIVARMTALGKRFLGDYGGLIDLQVIVDYVHSEGDLIPVVLGGNTSVLNWMKVNEAPWSLYFRNENWSFGMDVLVDTYWLTKRTPYRFVFKICLTLQLCRMAMDATGSGRKLYSYYMPSGWQPINGGYTEIRDSVFSGGTTRSLAFPKQDYMSRVFLGVAEFMHCDGRLQWSDGLRYGVNPDVIPDNDTNLNLITNGQPFRRAPVNYFFTEGDAGISADYFGGNNADEDAAKIYSLMVAHTGTQNKSFLSYRIGSSGGFKDIGNDYVIRRYQANEIIGYALIGSGVFAGHVAACGFTPPGTTWVTPEFSFNGQTYAPGVAIAPSTAFFFQIIL